MLWADNMDIYETVIHYNKVIEKIQSNNTAGPQ